MTDAAWTLIRMARLELGEVRDPAPQVRDAIRRLDDVLASRENDGRIGSDYAPEFRRGGSAGL